MYISLFFPLQDRRIKSIADIMLADGAEMPAHINDGLLPTGFGSGRYLERSSDRDLEGSYTFTSRGAQIRDERKRRREELAAQQQRFSSNGHSNGVAIDHRNGAGAPIHSDYRNGVGADHR